MTPPPAERPRIGLCATCVHARRIESARGSVFLRCALHDDAARGYPKYPRLPVITCAGFSPQPAAGGLRGE